MSYKVTHNSLFDDAGGLGDTGNSFFAPVASTSASASAQSSGFQLASDTITHTGSGLVFINTYGAGVSTTFHNEIVAAETYLESNFTNACTIRCSFDLQSLSHSFSGENNFSTISVTYTQYVNALQSHATSADDQAAVASLKNLADPSGGAPFEIPIATARMLGLTNSAPSVDDSVILNSYYWTASALQNYPNDAIAVILHEVTEGGMGRIGSLGIADPPNWAPLDLFRFTASGQRDFTGGRDGIATYFSTNGATVATGLQYHNSVDGSGTFDGFDFGDWDQVGADANAHDPFGPGGPGAGDPGTLSAVDLQIMDVLGWTKTGSAPAHFVANDFNNDGTSDILWGNSNSGEVDIWFINNGQRNGGTEVGYMSGAWQFAGVGDFNGDGTSAVLWRNTTTGEVDTWLISNGNLSGGGAIGSVSSAWQLLGTGDFNGDGTSDILWRNTNSGEVDTWFMNNGQRNGGAEVGYMPSAWQFAGVGDFNGDGTSDVLWRNTTTGEVDTWFISNGNLSGGGAIGSVSSAWQLLGTGDFNGDGASDILWRNTNSGEVDTWFMNNGQRNGGTEVGVVSGAWQFAGVGDLNGDGTSDILWRNTNSGEVDTWFMNNGQRNGGTEVGLASSAWQIQHTPTA